MNCRPVSSLLSAYCDAELTGEEMLALRAHLDICPACRAEHESLRATKRLLSSLTLRVPRPDFEAALRADIERAAHPVHRWLPACVLAWRDGAVPLPHPRPLAAAALSLTTLLFATATVTAPPDTSRERRATRAEAIPEVYPHYPYVSSGPFASSPPRASESLPLLWNEGRSPLLLSNYEGPPAYRGVGARFRDR